MYLGKALAKNPCICILHKDKNMKQYNAISLPEKPLHSANDLTLILASLVQYLVKKFHLIDQPGLDIREGIEPLLNRKFPLIDFEMHPRRPTDFMHAL